MVLQGVTYCNYIYLGLVGAGYSHGLKKSSMLCHECHSQEEIEISCVGASLSRVITQCGTLKIISFEGDSTFDYHVSLVVTDLLPGEGMNTMILSHQSHLYREHNSHEPP